MIQKYVTTENKIVKACQIMTTLKPIKHGLLEPVFDLELGELLMGNYGLYCTLQGFKQFFSD